MCIPAAPPPCLLLVHADVEDNRYVNKGCWDSIHVVEAVETAPKKASYKLTTTVMLTMSVAREDVGSTNLSGSLTRQVHMTRE